jgi:transposase InsO family protein
MSAAHTDYLVDVARAAAEAGHGQKEPIYQAACAHLNISRAELFRRLKQITVRPARKQRTDKGESAMSRDEAQILSGYVMEHIRRNGKRIKSVEQAVEELRANSIILAGTVDPATGEYRPLSVSAILRALWAYQLHPDQLSQPDPVTPLASEHPNDVWQIDASLCVLFKLPVKGRRIEEIRSGEAYKNKLQHLARIEHLLVQRYVITDHASGACYVHFALGGESAEGLVSALIAAMIERPNCPMHGAPNLLMLDLASANRSAMVRNLCRSLSIRLHYTQPGNPRSKGSVEGAHNLIEGGFESGLKCAEEIASVEQLQALVDKWSAWWNGSKKHSRHGMSRYEAWQLITTAQLRRVDVSAEDLRILARSDPKTPKVTPYLTVEFGGAHYDVSQVPDVIVGQKLPVCRSAYAKDEALVVLADEHGKEIYYPIPQRKQEGPFGFLEGAARIGQEYKRHADTPVQTAKKAIEKQVTGAATLEDAEKLRKKKVVPFGGAIDPYKQAREYEAPRWMPKSGTPVDVPRPQVELPKLTFTEFLARLSHHMGRDWTPEFYPSVREWYPEGAPETEIPVASERLRRKEEHRERVSLTVVK